MLLTHDHKEIAEELDTLLLRATNAGFLDVLQGYVKNPDSINDVCDALAVLHVMEIVMIQPK